MDKFFKELRKIQKKERSNSSLAKVDNDFYSNIYSYIIELKNNISDDPFSNETYLLKDTQRIATEICERREHKIAEAALMNIHRSFHLFKGKDKFDLVDTTPLNLTDEEETLYYSLMDSFKNHRNSISLDNFNNKEKDEEKEVSVKNEANIIDDKTIYSNESSKDDKVINRLNQINKAEILTDEKPESITKQIYSNKNNQVNTEDVNSQNKFKNDLENIRKSVDNQFVDLKEEDFLDSKIKDKDLEDNVLVLIFKDFNRIIGIDEKVYGPFKSQDLITLPKANANVIVRLRKGRIVEV